MTDLTRMTDKQEEALRLEDVRADRWALAYAVYQLERHDKFLRYISGTAMELEIVARAIDLLNRRELHLWVMQAFAEKRHCNPRIVRVAPKEER